jgi:hypothetical protein
LPAKQSAWFCVRESLHDFRLYEWAPFGWILLAQVVFLVAALNLGTVWGMAIAGGVARLVGRSEQIVHYPTVFILLPALASVVEWFLYVVAGSVLIPTALLRIAAPMEGGSASDRPARVRRAILPTLIAGALNIGLLEAWDWVLSRGVAPAIQSHVPGVGGLLLPWIVGALVSYAVAAPFVYVPIHAIRRGASLGSALVGGIGEGLRLLWPTFVIILVCSWPALLVLAAVQINPGAIVQKMRPELVAYLLLAYAVITSLASYLIYASGSRLHWARRAA